VKEFNPRVTRRELFPIALTTPALLLLACAQDNSEKQVFQENRIRSLNYPYSIIFPEGWTPINAEVPELGNMDVFTPYKTQLSRTMITIFAEPKRDGVTLGEEFEYQMKSAAADFRNLGLDAVLEPVSTPGEKDPDNLNVVGGKYKAYRFNSRWENQEQTTIMFEAQDKYWYIQMLTISALTLKNLPILKEMISTFKLAE